MRDHHLIIQMCAATTTTKYVNCGLAGTLLETRVSSSLLMYETPKLVLMPKQRSFQL